jgi:hypothetical protein
LEVSAINRGDFSWKNSPTPQGQERTGKAGKGRMAGGISDGGKCGTDAKLMQKPASVTKPLQTMERVNGIEPSFQSPFFAVC